MHSPMLNTSGNTLEPGIWFRMMITDVGDATQTTGHIIWLHLCVKRFEIF